jgi:NTP pyrophosphatase (non-canonical NTP hydrolase)
MKTTKELVLQWAKDKNLLKKENSLKQYTKLQEESNELLIAILDKDIHEQQDALGDVLVVITILANQLGFDIEECFDLAYNEIKNRKGRTINGNFVKDEESKN